MGDWNPKWLKEYFWAKLNWSRNDTTLKYEYVNIRRVWNFSYYMVNDYPQVNLFADKPQSNINKCEISKEDIAKAIVLLRDEEDYENCLLLMLISKYYLCSGVLVLIRFEDFGTTKDGQRFLNIFTKRIMRHQIVYIDEQIFEWVRLLKRFRLNWKKHQYETNRTWGKDLKIKGYFIFPVQRCLIGKRLQNGFNGKIPKFWSSLSKIISICKSDLTVNE